MEAKPKTNVRPKNMNPRLTLEPLVNTRRTQRNDKCPVGVIKNLRNAALTKTNNKNMESKTQRIVISKSATRRNIPKKSTRYHFTEQVVYKTKVGKNYVSETRHEIVR